MMTEDKVSLLGYEINLDPKNALINLIEDAKNSNSQETIIVNTINSHSYTVALDDEHLRCALKGADILVADGEGIVLADRVLVNSGLKKFAGMNLFMACLEYLSATKGSCFFLGSTDHTLKLIHDRIEEEYPDITAYSLSPPFKNKLDEDDNKIIFEKINDLDIDIVFVGMTAPKQEKWVYENAINLNAGALCSIGAVFDFYAGTIKRPSDMLVNLKLEWLGRFVSNPKKMWRRVIVSSFVMIWHIIIEKTTNSHNDNTRLQK